MSKITKQQLDAIVSKLEIIKMHPQMYIADGIPPAYNFLQGFVSACHSLDIVSHDRYRSIFDTVSKERGWKYPSGLLWDQMSEAGLSDDEITHELLALYVEVWRRVGNTLSREE